MKNKFAIFLLLIFISCKTDEKNKVLKQHNPYEHINQELENERSIELYLSASDNIAIGNFEVARELLNKSYDVEKSPIILNELGTTYKAERKYDEALSFYNKSISLDKTYYPSHINKAIILAIQSDYKNAENTLNKMIAECNSDYWIAYANFSLSTIYFNTKESCKKIQKYLNKSKILKEDVDLKQQFLNFEKKVEYNCG
jgi:tetratricopeptide (TPR) repeat protein